MTSAFRFEFDDDGLQKALAKSPDLVRRELRAAMLDAQLILMRESREMTPTVFGLLRNSIVADQPIEQADGELVGTVASPLNYAPFVELGTKPHWAPLAPLQLWAEKKFGVDEKAANRIGRAVRYKIAQRGTEGKFMFARALQQQEASITERFSRAHLRILQGLAGRI